MENCIFEKRGSSSINVNPLSSDYIKNEVLHRLQCYGRIVIWENNKLTVYINQDLV